MFKKESQEAIELLQEMISTPSFSREEHDVANLLMSFIKNKGYTPKRIANNIYIAGEIKENRPTLLLNSHIDTVKPATGWGELAFIPTIKDGMLYGLGSNDAGASLVSLLQLFILLEKQKQKYNLIFLASAEEEISGENGVALALKELPPIDFSVVGEPTDMHLAVAEKGLMVLDCTATGKAGHAARDEGDNAIYKAIKDIEWFQNYSFENKSPFLGEIKMSVTQINAGSQHNVVPDTCKFVIDVRVNELYTNQEILDIIKEHVACDVVARSTRLNSSRTPEQHPIVKRAKELKRNCFGSPTLSDQALMPFNTVKLGPGSSSRSHTAFEYIKLSEIEEAIILYFELLNGLDIQ